MSSLERSMGRRKFLRTAGELIIIAGVTSSISPERNRELEIPQNYLDLYQLYGKDFWHILASVGKQESNHGRSDAPGVKKGVNGWGCAGPMQFNTKNKLASTGKSTWDYYKNTYKGPGEPNIYDPRYAIPAAAQLLEDDHVREDPRSALKAYSGGFKGYEDEVLKRAKLLERHYIKRTPQEILIKR